MRTALVLIAVLFAVLLAPTASAQFSFTEEFDDNEFLDAAETTADWNTSVGELRFFPYVPTLLHSEDTEGSARGIHIEGNIAYVADGTRGVQIFDISNPLAPSLLYTYDTEGFTYQVQVEGNYAYLADWEAGLKVLDVSFPDSPALVGVVLTDDAHLGIEVHGDHAYVADGAGGLRIYDVSEPWSPDITAIVDVGAGSRVTVSGEHAYLAAQALGVLVFDVSDPEAPVQVGSYDTPGAASDVVVAGNLAYVADNDGGLQILDVTDPANPTLTGALVLSGETRGLMVDGDIAYLASGPNDLRIIDVTDPTAPALLTQVSHPGACYDMAMNGEHLLVVAQTAGLLTMQGAEWVEPRYDDRTDITGTATDIVVDGDLAFATSDMAGFWSLSLADPTHVEYRHFTSTPSTAMCLDLAGDYLYVGTASHGLRVYDVSDPDNPVYAGQQTSVSAVDLQVQGNRAYLLESTRLTVLTLDNPTVPAIMNWTNITVPVALDVQGDVAYVATSLGGLVSVDVQDGWTPQILQTLPIGAGPRDLEVQGDMAYVAGGPNGLLLVDVSDPTGMSLRGSHNPDYLTTGVAVVGDRVLAANSAWDVVVYDVSDPTDPLDIGYHEAFRQPSDLVLAGDRAITVSEAPSSFYFRNRQRQRDTNLARSLDFAQANGNIVRVRMTPYIEGAELEFRAGTNGWDVYTSHLGSWDDVSNPDGGNLEWRVALDWLDSPDLDSITIDWQLDCGSPVAVTDVPDDQGGRVHMEIMASAYDDPGETEIPVTAYDVYRRVDDPALAQRVPQEGTPDTRLPGLLSLEHQGQRLVAGTRDEFPEGVWVQVTSLSALQAPSYLVEVPTQADHPFLNRFVVTTHTTTPSVWFVSGVISGYSIDNLAPAMPTGLVADVQPDGVALDWDDAPEADFDRFRVYRGITAEFEPADDNLVAETVASTWQDGTAEPWAFHYKVAAVDHAGNEGQAAATDGLVGVGDTPRTLVLQSAMPNPFNPQTTIRFSLPTAGRAQLSVYDMSGRLVRTLVNEHLAAGEHAVPWLGRNDRGREVASGVYLYRLEAGGVAQSKAMVLVR